MLRAFSLALKLVRSVGLTRPLRRLVGPFAGKLILRVSNPSNRPLDVRGHQMVLAAPGRYPPVAMAMGEYEEQTTSLFERTLKPGMVMMDVGAHVGYFSLLAARQVGSEGKVFSFEPDPINHELLVQNIELNQYNNIFPVNAAMGDNVGSLTLFQTALDSGRHSTYRHGLPESGSVEVDVSTLDAFLDARDWPGIDLVKVDVEGAEMDVLRGMAGLLEKSPGLKLIMEFNPALLQSAGVPPSDMIQELKSRGFNLSYIHEKRGVIPMEQLNVEDLVAELLRADNSVNLYCAKS
jgi:FkbM family methyltransferase